MTSDGVNFLKPSLVHIPISILSSVICPSNDSFNVSIAVWIASSSPNFSEYLFKLIIDIKHYHINQSINKSILKYLFSKNVLPFIWFLPIAVAFHAK